MGSNEFTETSSERTKQAIQQIAISKIEEFASILDDTIDTTELERVPFEKRIPIGMYAFTYLEEEGMDISCEVMVYDSTAEAYRNLMDALPDLFQSFGLDEEYLPDSTLETLEQQCRDTFFIGEMIPSYEEKDIISILKYYAQKDAAPRFYTFEEIDRDKLDVAGIAKHIWDEDMGARKKAAYIDQLWDSGDEEMLRLFFGKKLHFLRQLDIELLKLSGGYDSDEGNVTYGIRNLVDLPLYEIGRYNPKLEKQLREVAFEKSKTADGQYQCACCGKKWKSRIYFQVDHIIPMNKGGKSIAENLQILCRSCNGRKSDQI